MDFISKSARAFGFHSSLEYFGLITNGCEPEVSKSRSDSSYTNNLAPLQFHSIHGENITISSAGTVARRSSSFCNGLTFTNRPIKVNEKIYIKLKEVSNTWSGVVRFGLTNIDPAHFSNTPLPKYACPDLSSQKGFWAKAVGERYAVLDVLLCFYVDSSGEVHYSINNEDKGVFFCDVDTRSPLWAIIDVYGNSTAVELVNFRTPLNNAISAATSELPDNFNSYCRRNVETAVEPMVVQQSSRPSNAHDFFEGDVPESAYRYTELPFNATICGRNIHLSEDKLIAARSENEYCDGCVFSSRSISPKNCLAVQILGTESMYVGGLAFGLTSCNPALLTPNDLPNDIDEFTNRREYWVICKDVADSPSQGDELLFWYNENGDIMIRKNNGKPNFVFHVDKSVELWPFFELYGSTLSVRMFISEYYPSRPISTPKPPTNFYYKLSKKTQYHVDAPVAMLPHFSSEVKVQPHSDGSASLVLHIPPYMFNSPTSENIVARRSSANPICSPHITSNPLRRYEADVPVVQMDCGNTSWPIKNNPPAPETDCNICYEYPVDTALYDCGHMCLCHRCAFQLWQGRGDGHCPICRAYIRDVIRIYKA